MTDSISYVDTEEILNGLEAKPAEAVEEYRDDDPQYVDECQASPSVCVNHAYCSNTYGCYICTCNQGFQKLDNGQCGDINECLNSPCPINGICDNTEGGYYCSCNQGYHMSGSLCLDVNECAGNSSLCPVHASCVNLAGYYKCVCDAGFVNQSGICADLDECTIVDSCPPYSICNNTYGSYQCNCREGFQNVGVLCRDTDECTANICPQNGVCHNSIGSYYCTCKPGYQMQGLICIDKNECTQEINVCQLRANCTNTDGSYRCTCMTGFSEMSGLCTDVDECLNSPCSGHANCTNMFGSYTCTCNEGYHMINQVCQDINECLFSPCLAHSACENFGGGYKCTCVNGYSKGLTGICTDVNECFSHPCGSFEDCINTAGSYHCNCMDGYVKTENGTCSDKDECSAVISPCPANSNCLNLPGSFQCVCYNGYYQAGPKNCIESRVFKVYARVTHLDGVQVFHSAVYDNQSSVNATHFMDRFDSAILVILNSTSLDRGYLGQRVYNISAGSLVIDGYFYYNISSPVTDSQLQAALSANTTLYQTTGLLVDLTQTYVTDVDECQQPDWNECSVYANCANTIGSYNCTCFLGYLDISPDPNKPGRTCAVISEVNQDPIKGLRIMANEPAFALGKTVTFTATMERGSHVNYKIQYGDGITAVALNPDQLAFRMPYNFSHSYNIVGNFTVILFASNNISNESASMNMIVQSNFVATSLTLTSTELDLVYSGDLNLMIMPNSTNLMFNNVHLTWKFGDGLSSYSYLDQMNSTNVFMTRHKYGLGEFTLIANISNLVSWVTLIKSFFVEELITGLEVSATPTILKPNDAVTLIISTATGSNITLEINSGNGNKEMVVLNNIQCGSYMYIMTITYDKPGDYNITVNARNVKSNISYALLNTIFVQNPVQDLVARVDPYIAIPPSVITLNITYPKNVSTAPTSVTCNTFLNDLWKTTQFIQNITSIKPLLIHVNASGFLDEVKVSINCSNKLSNQVFQAWIVLQSVVSGVYIESDKLYIPIDGTVNFKFHVGGGSHISYEYIFGNDLPRTGVLPSQIYLDYIINDTYTYGLPGFYSLKFTAKNLVSQITTNRTIGVLEEIKGLTLSRFYYPSDTNKTQHFGHGDSGNIFPLERNLVLNYFVLSGNDVMYMIDLGNGQNISTRNLTVFYRYRNPGTYTITVNASNSLYWQQKNFTIEVHQTIQLYLLRNSGPSEAYLMLNLTLSLSRVGTNSCLLWNFGDSSTPVLYGGYSCMQEAGNAGYTYKEWNGSFMLTHSHMYRKNGTFTVTVNGFNKVSTASITNIVLITGISCFYPIVHFIGGGQVIDNPVTTLLSDWVSLESTAVINCTSTKSAEYKWKIFRVVQGLTYLDISYQEFNADIAKTDRLKSYFPPRTLDIGLFKIVINVSMTGIPGLYSEDYQYLRVIPSPLVAKIKGGNARAVGYGKIFTLNAQDESYDPDVDVNNKTDFVYEWWCRQEWETFSESGINEITIPTVDEMHNLTREGGCFGTGIGKLHVFDGIFELSSLLLQPNSTNIFHLILHKGDRQAVFDQSIQVVLGDPPDFSLRCVVNCRSKMNPSSEFGMVSNCTVCHPLDNIKYIWSLYLERKDSVEFDMVPNLQSLLATNISGVGIVFKPRTLIGGRLYKLRLDAVVYGYTPTFTEYKFITNLPPYGGKCKIEPETGMFLIYLFFISFTGLCKQCYLTLVTISLNILGKRNIPLDSFGGDDRVHDILGKRNMPLDSSGGDDRVHDILGYAIQTQFQILCSDWLNPGEEEARGEGLLYRFWTSPQGSNYDQLLYYGTDPFTPGTQFPLGVEEFNYMHNVVVTIANSIGEYVETNLTVQVKPAGTDSLDHMINMTSGDSNKIQNMLKSGKDQEVKQWFVAVASLINTNVSVIATTTTTTKTTTPTTVTPVPSSASNITLLVNNYTSLLPASTTKVTTKATIMTSVATTTLSPEELARRKQAEEEDKRKRTVVCS
ncbi:hypothetical protein CHS0354_032019 [Potamilus streckersoni]|uniref:Uncharacterized protein n=1 Tax=Potamilus streckersoni TaxID=2493646 RepID=A0AAE0WEK7_9BIVA|nr:hypothetical protein CHS0354_032019 [Potamilus streckersoni]